VTRALVLALVLLASACAREPEHAYPPEVVENFVAACRTRAPDAACRCAIDRLRDRFSYEEFRALERRMGSGEVPGEVTEAVESCTSR
jgi:hypothetical protein